MQRMTRLSALVFLDQRHDQPCTDERGFRRS